MKKLILLFLIQFFIAAALNAQAMNIKLTVHGLENSTVILANYYGDKQFVKDTFDIDRNGDVQFKADTMLPGGVYLAVFPALGNKYFEFIVNEPSFSIETDKEDLTGHVKVRGSVENNLFYDDMKLLGTMRQKSDELNALYKNASNATDKEGYRGQLVQIDNEVKARRNEIISNNPQTFYAKLLRAMKDIVVPEPPKDAYGKVKDETFQWRYYKAHYWDNIDFREENLLRCPVFHNKLKTYFTQTLVQSPDSLIAGSEELLSKTDKKNAIYRYILTYMFNEMANSKVMGFDGVYVYLGKSYFCKKHLSPWLDDDQRQKICTRVEKLEPVLVGKTAQKLILKTVEGDYQSLQGISAKYTILSFWDVDCGHCKKEMPVLSEAYRNLKNAGISVEGYSVMIGDGSLKGEWKRLISNYNLDWINVADLDRESNFRSDWDVQSAPQFYILDQNKKIVARRIGAEQVEDFIKHAENPEHKFKTALKAATLNDDEDGMQSITQANTGAGLNQAQKPKQPAVLSIKNMVFKDTDKNSMLDGNEKASISFSISNSGKGAAYNVKVKTVEITGSRGMFFDLSQNVGTIEPGSTTQVSIDLNGTKALSTGRAIFKIIAQEGNGFDSDPVEIEIKTKEFLAAKVVVADYAFSTESGGAVKLGVTINLRAIIQNVGQGVATNVAADFSIPANVFPSDATHFDIGELQPGSSKIINFEFFGNKQYASAAIPVTIELKEVNGYAEEKKVEVKLEQVLVATEKVQVAGNSSGASSQIQMASLTPDVDKNIPINTNINSRRYALVIGNEDYTKYQTNLGGEINVAYAANDARIFAAYCEKTLGVPKENITLLENAISSKMRQKVEEISKLIQYEGGNAEVIVYYAGHGFPDETTKESYIMPVDISGANVTEGIKLSELYKKLTQFPVKRVTVFLDACFSGGGRDAGLLAARAVKIQPKANAISGNLVVISASSGEQSALPYKDKQHGMFTYFLLKKLQESKGDIFYKDLYEYVKHEVEINSIKVNSKDQNPQMNVSQTIEPGWASWKVK